MPLHAEVLELLARLPAPKEALALRPSACLSQHVSELVEKGRLGALSPSEQAEWEQIAHLEHLVRVAKAKAATKQKKH